jgi:uncharacterized protein
MSSREPQDALPASPGTPTGLPAAPGVGFKPTHFEDLQKRVAEVGFIEVHAENYMGAGGEPHFQLSALRELYTLSLHGVGLSIGGESPLDEDHLARLKTLVDRYRPSSFSEHLAWSSHDATYLNDLLPVAYDTRTLQRVADHIDLVQERLGLRMLLENPSTYVAFTESNWDEIDFIAEIARRTGCGLLLDCNNVAVTCANHGRDPEAYVDAFPIEHVGEMHLAGYAEQTDSLGAPLLIDAHGSPVAGDVWGLYQRALTRSGPIATLIEWDNDVPTFDVLLAEARKAHAHLRREAGRRNRSAA